MASAGTIRFPAPAATFRVLRSRFLAIALVILHGMAMANLLAWFYWAARPAPVTIALALLAWSATAFLSARACYRPPEGWLTWDTEGWNFQRDHGPRPKAGTSREPVSLGLSAEVAFDLQFCMMLKFGKAARLHWVLVTRKHDSFNWLALRRAVYSPAMAVRLPDRADEVGAFPPA